MEGCAVNVIQFQGQPAATDILILQLQAVDGVVQLAVNAFTVGSQRGVTVNFHPFEQRQLFAFHANRQFVQRDSLFTDTFVEAGHFGGAIGFQIIKGELNFLVVLVDGVNLPATGFAAQAEGFPLAVGIQLELSAAKRHFLIAFRVIKRVEHDSGLVVAAISDTGINGERRFAFSDVEQRLAGVVIGQRGFDGRHRRSEVKGFQRSQRERTVIDDFIKHQRLPGGEPAGRFAGNGLQHQL